MHQTGKTYVYEVDGLAKKMPLTFGCLTVASLSLMGIPLFAGFISKWNIAEAAFACGSLALAGGSRMGILPYLGTAVILYSALMTGVYMLTVHRSQLDDDGAASDLRGCSAGVWPVFRASDGVAYGDRR